MKTNHLKILKRYFNILLVGSLMIVVSLGCLGSGSSELNCEGTVTAGGRKFNGRSDDKRQAALNACNFYCLEQDSQFESMYRIWLDSASGKRLAERKKRQPTKKEAMFESKKLLDYITETCAKRCLYKYP